MGTCRLFMALIFGASVFEFCPPVRAERPKRSEVDLRADGVKGSSAAFADTVRAVRSPDVVRFGAMEKDALWRAVQAERDQIRAFKLDREMVRLRGALSRGGDNDAVSVSGFGFGGACCSPEGPDYDCQANIDEFECLNAGWGFAGIGTSCSSGVCLLRCEDSSCDWCWVDTLADGNCPSEWNGDGSCDCGCQYCDSDCPGCGSGGDTRACCGPDNNVDQCLNGLTPSECLGIGGAPQGATTCSGVGSCIRCVDECDWCWFGTAAEDNCPLEFFGDGECDCGCQFCDTDCASCGPCCSPSVTDPECIDGYFVDDCLLDGGLFDAEALLCSEAACLPCEGPNCVWCWTGTVHEGDCDPSWDGDGSCDCGCQFCDSDCAECGCPVGALTFQNPPAGLVDARMPPTIPGVAGSAGAIGTLSLEGPVGIEDPCWSLCTQGPPGYQNAITQVVRVGDRYLIVLQNALAPDSCTVLTYTDLNGTPQHASYFVHPGNVNGDGAANSNDIAYLIGVLGGVAPPYGTYSTDINRSGMTTPGDILALIDVLNGAGSLDAWNNTQRRACGACLPP